MPATLTCPECGEDVWDLPYGHKLAKCWNTEGHADGGTLAFDTMSDDEDETPAITASVKSECRRGYWIRAGSAQLRTWDRHVIRHPNPEPPTWREDKDILTTEVLKLYPDAAAFRYKGGVLRFRWNAGEGSGEAYESGTTPGPEGPSA